MKSTLRPTIWFAALLTLFLAMSAPVDLLAAEDGEDPSIPELIDSTIEPFANLSLEVVFFSVPIFGQSVPVVLLILAFTAIFLTIYFGFINFRGFGLAIKTTTGKYTDPKAPGQITHFQALTAALSATVGLGNIAGVAIAIGIGGPGATVWMILLGLFGMTTKFAECTLGVKYRRIDSQGRAHGGAMYYLQDGLASRGLAPLGTVLAIFFAVFVIGGAFGAGNMYQANQAFSQFDDTWLAAMNAQSDIAPTVFGIVVAILVGMVIIGGIVWIARVTALLVPLMCGIYVLTALIIILTHMDQVIPAFGIIIDSAFGAESVAGGFIGALIQGVRRAAFSNEAGLGSAPIAHSAVKTDKPASEGFVALLEPFVDTVVVCTMTALVIVITGAWQVSGFVKEDAGDVQMLAGPGSGALVQTLDSGQHLHIRNIETLEDESEWKEVIGLVSAEKMTEATKVLGWVNSEQIEPIQGVERTSMAFEDSFVWFRWVLSVAVILFAFSTMISWSYYGEQGVIYLFRFMGDNVKIPVLIYKVVFCLLVIVGSSASLGNILNLSDSMVFAMVVPNLIGLYLLLPVIRKEAKLYMDHVKTVDAQK